MHCSNSLRCAVAPQRLGVLLVHCCALLSSCSSFASIVPRDDLGLRSGCADWLTRRSVLLREEEEEEERYIKRLERDLAFIGTRGYLFNITSEREIGVYWY